MGIRLLMAMSLVTVSELAWAQLPPPPKETDAETQKHAQLFVAQRVQDLGTVLEGDKITVRWRLENRGKGDLIIDRTRSSCGCTVVKLAEAEKIVPPGRSLELGAVFDSSRRRGAQNKNITLYSNDPTEPVLKLEFKAQVQSLYEIKPAGLVNLQRVRRGETASKTVDVHPGAGRKAVEILGIEAPNETPLTFRHESFEAGPGLGQRIHVTVDKYVGLGPFTAKAKVKVGIGDIEREREITFRGEVVGDLTWRPQTVDATRQAAHRGKQFAPVTISSTDSRPFEIYEATGGPLFDVTVKPSGKTTRGGNTRYTVVLTLREDAPSGPFGTALHMVTSALDQPVVDVSVFGIVARPIEVDPPMVLLRQDGTEVGGKRRVKLQVPPQKRLRVVDLSCDLDGIETSVDREASSRYSHIRYLIVTLARQFPEGEHHAVLTVTAEVDGARPLAIPVRVEVPGPGG